jgi:hypothetical protein
MKWWTQTYSGSGIERGNDGGARCLLTHICDG